MFGSPSIQPEVKFEVSEIIAPTEQVDAAGQHDDRLTEADEPKRRRLLEDVEEVVEGREAWAGRDSDSDQQDQQPDDHQKRRRHLAHP